MKRQLEIIGIVLVLALLVLAVGQVVVAEDPPVVSTSETVTLAYQPNAGWFNATLQGSITYAGYAKCFFEFGFTDEYGYLTRTRTTRGNANFTQNIRVVPGVIYYYRAVAIVGASAYYGEERTLTPAVEEAVTFVGGDLVADTLTVENLTSGRIPIVGTGGLLGDDADFVFSGDTATITKLNSTMVDITSPQVYTARTAGATAANGTTWVDLLDKSTLTRPEEIFGITLTTAGGWAGLCQFRIVNAGGDKIYPFSADYWTENTGFVSGSYLPLVCFTIAKAQGYKVQFRSSNAGDGAGKTCALTLLDTFQR